MFRFTILNENNEQINVIEYDDKEYGITEMERLYHGMKYEILEKEVL